MLRRSWFALALSALVSQVYAVEYTLVDLIGSGQSSEANGINNLGQVIGSVGNTAFIWQNDAFYVVDDLLGSSRSGKDINDHGLAVINIDNQAWVYDSFSRSFISRVGLDSAIGSSINNDGKMVGEGSFPGSENYSHAFLSNGPDVVDIGFGWETSQGMAINSSGCIALTVVESTHHQGYLAAGDSLINVGALDASNQTQLYGLNKNMQAVGSSVTMGTWHACMWDSHKGMIDLGSIGYYSYARDINDLGQIVGGSAGSAFIYDNGVIQDLNSLATNLNGWHLYEATAINDNGWIVGFGSNSFGETSAFLLKPNSDNQNPSVPSLTAVFPFLAGIITHVVRCKRN